MNIYESLTAHLTGDPNPVEFLFNGPVPEGVDFTSAARFQLVSGANILTHDGLNPSMIGRFQFDGVSDDIIQAHNMRLLLRNKLSGFVGVMGGTGGVLIQYLFPVGPPRDVWDPDYNRWFCQQDYQIQYVEE